MNITVGILAHVDAGKTTFAEQVLYHKGRIRQRGRVDHKNAFMDSHEIEKSRGITVFSDQAFFQSGTNRYFLIDTPGHIDFSAEMERTLKVMDYGILVIDGVEGIQSHTETVWHLLRKHGIPTFLFINKMDREGAELSSCLEEIRSELTPDVFLFHQKTLNGDFDSSAKEFLAERDEAALECYLEEQAGNIETTDWLELVKALIQKGLITPCFYGSALTDSGIETFLSGLEILSETSFQEDVDAPLEGQVYKIRYDEKGNRIVYIKLLKGRIQIKDEIAFYSEGQLLHEKVHEIRRINGSQWESIESAEAGELIGITGFEKLKAGDPIGEHGESLRYEMTPTMGAKVLFPESIHIKEVLKGLYMLEEEDPTLCVRWEEVLKEIHVRIMGTIQLEILKQVFQERFGIKIDFGTPEVLYKETIKKTLYGYGHFEPLKHYAEVHLRIEPGERGSGIQFFSECHADDMTTGNQNLVGTHILEKEHRGYLIGGGLTDMKVTLLTGRAHAMHTSGGDFREATLRALRQGLESGSSDDSLCILEPYYRFKLVFQMDHMGKILAELTRRCCIFDPPIYEGERMTVHGRGPVSTLVDFSTEYISLTKGRGRLQFFVDGYDFCHDEDSLMKQRKYDPGLDPEYPSSSIFCSKGQGYTIPGSEAKEHMHCSTEKR